MVKGPSSAGSAAILLALAANLILLLAAGGIANGNGSFIMDGPDVVGVRSAPFT
jgi:hypothetical protein